MKKILFYSLPRFVEALLTFVTTMGTGFLKYFIELATNMLNKIEALLRYMFSTPWLIIATIVAFNALALVIFWVITTEGSFFETMRMLKAERYSVLWRAGFLFLAINWCYNHMLSQTANDKFITRVITVVFSVFLIPVLLSAGGFHFFDMKSGAAILVALRLVLVWQEFLKPKGIHTSIGKFFANMFAKKYVVLHRTPMHP